MCFLWSDEPLTLWPKRSEDCQDEAPPALKCPSCQARLLGHKSAASCFSRLSVALQLATRGALKRYYEGWMVCDDSACGARTRQLSGAGPRCLRRGCRGRMVAEESEKRIYTQLCYQKALFLLTGSPVLRTRTRPRSAPSWSARLPKTCGHIRAYRPRARGVPHLRGLREVRASVGAPLPPPKRTSRYDRRRFPRRGDGVPWPRGDSAGDARPRAATVSGPCAGARVFGGARLRSRRRGARRALARLSAGVLPKDTRGTGAALMMSTSRASSCRRSRLCRTRPSRLALKLGFESRLTRGSAPF